MNLAELSISGFLKLIIRPLVLKQYIMDEVLLEVGHQNDCILRV